MKLYSAIDLHSNNNVLVIIDENDRVVCERRLPNRLPMVLSELSPHHGSIEAIAVESTYNWYWLVDGLMDAGYTVKLVNTAAVKTYEGLKYSGDEHDARHLAHLMRLGVLPTGYIYPKEVRIPVKSSQASGANPATIPAKPSQCRSVATLGRWVL